MPTLITKGVAQKEYAYDAESNTYHDIACEDGNALRPIFKNRLVRLNATPCTKCNPEL